MKIENRNIAIPLTEEVTTESIAPGGDRSIQDSEDRKPRAELGIANAPDTFENVATAKSVIDPIGYPGEEWLWQEATDDNEAKTLLTVEQFHVNEAGVSFRGHGNEN